MNIVVPYVAGQLRDETRRAVRGAPLDCDIRFVELTDDEAYWRLWQELWAARQDVIVVEQDIEPRAGVFGRFDACPEPWCAHAYSYSVFGEYAGTGCVRFRAELLNATPHLMKKVGEMSNPHHPPRHWCSLDAFMQHQLRQAGFEMHRHEPAVTHLDVGNSHGCVPVGVPA